MPANAANQAAEAFQLAYTKAINTTLEAVQAVGRPLLPIEIESLATQSLIGQTPEMARAYDAAGKVLSKELADPGAKVILDGYFSGDMNYLLSETVKGATVAMQESVRGIIGRESAADITNRIFERLKDTDDALTIPQARTLADSALSNSTRATTSQVAQGLPPETKWYALGPVDGKTRDVCLGAVAAGPMTLVDWARNFPGYAKEGGGWNCRHRLAQVTEASPDFSGRAANEISKKDKFEPLTPPQERAKRAQA